MGNENGEWIMHGVRADDPKRIKSVSELEAFVDYAGFLPLFKNDVTGFSLEEYTLACDWWTDDPERDPWQWRKIAAAGKNIAYGKFFGKKAGFVSLKWLPAFANARRDGYDFEALWDDEKASWRQKRIMGLFSDGNELTGPELKKRAGFATGGEKNFEGTITELQMLTYLVISDFRCRVNKAGFPYGWPVTVYATPESIWGADIFETAYDEQPCESEKKVYQHLMTVFPGRKEQEWNKILKP